MLVHEQFGELSPSSCDLCCDLLANKNINVTFCVEGTPLRGDGRGNTDECDCVNVSQSGLTQAVRDSKVTLEQAEYEFLSFVRQHTPPGQCPLAGESVL